MRLIILAFTISILLHFLTFNYIEVPKEEVKPNTQKTELKRADVTFVQIKKQVQKPKTIEKAVKKEPVKKPVPKKKKVVKKEPIKKPKKIVKPKKVQKPKPANTVKKVVKKPTKKVIKKPVKKVVKKHELQNKILKEQIVNEKTSIQQKTLENFLSQKDPVDKKVLSQIERLYGREFQTFTKVQKVFIEKNLNNFQRITQRVLNRLGYPPIAAKLKIAGTNVVEFTLYPNGNIKNLKITTSSGYSVLDKYTIELIEIAYKDYPRPKTATKLKFYVNYRLY